jgi:hypothetical protein
MDQKPSFNSSLTQQSRARLEWRFLHGSRVQTWRQISSVYKWLLRGIFAEGRRSPQPQEQQQQGHKRVNPVEGWMVNGQETVFCQAPVS